MTIEPSLCAISARGEGPTRTPLRLDGAGRRPPEERLRVVLRLGHWCARTQACLSKKRMDVRHRRVEEVHASVFKGCGTAWLWEGEWQLGAMEGHDIARACPDAAGVDQAEEALEPVTDAILLKVLDEPLEFGCARISRNNDVDAAGRKQAP